MDDSAVACWGPPQPETGAGRDCLVPDCRSWLKVSTGTGLTDSIVRSLSCPPRMCQWAHPNAILLQPREPGLRPNSYTSSLTAFAQSSCPVSIKVCRTGLMLSTMFSPSSTKDGCRLVLFLPRQTGDAILISGCHGQALRTPDKARDAG